MRPRRRLLDGPFALALSLALHGLVLGPLSFVLGFGQGQRTEDAGRAATLPVHVTLLSSSPVPLDRDPLVLPAAPSGQELPEIPAPLPLPPLPGPLPFAVTQGPGQGIRDQEPAPRDKGQGTKERGQNGFFPGAGQATSVVFVIDRSMSMGRRGAFDAARRELLASLERLPEHVRFQVIVYNRTAELLVPGAGLAEATAERKRHTAARIEALCAEGGTSHLPALRRAIGLSPEVIYFLTDADDLNLQEQQAVTKLNRGRCSIHVIELNTSNRDRPGMPLQELARANRGTYRAIDLLSYRD
jgi:hypothetical protein